MLKRQRPPNVLEACAGARNIALKMKLGDQAKLSRPASNQCTHSAIGSDARPRESQRAEGVGLPARAPG